MRSSVEKIKQLLASEKEIFRGDASYHLHSLRNAPEMASVIWEIKKALELGIAPERMQEATSEVYRFFDREKRAIAVFKPSCSGMKQGIKEVAAYRLDHAGFAGVLPTVFAEFSHPILQGTRSGSCQQFFEDGIPVVFVERKSYENFSCENVRRIAILDIRTINTDRHTSNLLAKEKLIVPIDHAAILPLALYGTYYTWVHWRQARTPFSKEEREYIEWLNPYLDRQLLLEEFKLPQESADLCFCSTVLLQESVKRHLNASQIGNLLICKRKDATISEPAPFEKVLKKIQSKPISEWNMRSLMIREEIKRFVNEEAYQCANKSADCRISRF